MNYTRFIFFVYGFAFVTKTLLHLAVFLFGLAGVVYLKGEGNAE